MTSQPSGQKRTGLGSEYVDCEQMERWEHELRGRERALLTNEFQRPINPFGLCLGREKYPQALVVSAPPVCITEVPVSITSFPLYHPSIFFIFIHLWHHCAVITYKPQRSFSLNPLCT